jgi:NAD(P)H-nitrite reductase large subunit
MRCVIIGNSAAAVGAVEAMRQHDQERDITIVADEPHHVYSRPLISYLLGGTVTESLMFYRPPDFYDRYKVDAMLGAEVVRITPPGQTISLAGGGTLSYDQLLIATGGVPLVPSIPGIDLEGVFTFTRWDDARRIKRYIEEHGVRSALVVGGGLIGLKTTEALMARSIRVTVVELADRILSVSFDRTASRLAESLLRRAGTEIRIGTTVEKIVGKDGRVEHVVLRDRERVDCDLVVFAVGVRPNADMVPQDAGIGVNRGILVDSHMHTSALHVYAAGDCVETYDMLLEVSRPIAIWPNAYRQGYVAGCNMAGVEKEYAGGFPMNSVEVCGVPSISVGITAPQEESMEGYDVIERHGHEVPTYQKLVLRGNRLVGAICVGDIDRAGIYTGLIRDQVDVGPFRDHLLAGDFGLISLPREYRKHMVVGDGIVV